MRTTAAMVAFLILGPATALAGQASATAATPLLPAWHFDLAGAAFHEAWDFNGSTESLAGAFFGIDRRVWRRVALRVELPAVHIFQSGDDAWLGGVTVGTRFRWRPHTGASLFVEISVGASEATRPTPPGGTNFNYLALMGGGVEVPFRRVYVSVTGRWFHVSNASLEGSGRNPDIQSLGVLFGVGWRSGS
jgi:hypothetical protein